MENPKWWSVAVVTLVAVLSAMILFLTDAFPVDRMLAAQATLACFFIVWFTLGLRSFRSPKAAVAFIILMVALTGIGTALQPTLASLQCVAYPLIWVIVNGTRRALVANVILALTVAVAFMVRFGFSPESILNAAFIATLSLGFSIALGLWISHIFDLSAERLTLIDELKSAEGKLAALHREAGIVSERERLSRELHDTLAQDLTGLIMLVQGARRDLDSADLNTARTALELVEQNAREALVETRSLVAAGASVEVPGGLVPALHRLSERFERETGVAVTATARDLPTLNRDTEVVLLRCAQEALANIRKHSRATTATVDARRSDAAIELCVTDDGVGFEDHATTSGFGLAGMRDRLALVEGTLNVESTPRGTVLTVRIPAVVLA